MNKLCFAKRTLTFMGLVGMVFCTQVLRAEKPPTNEPWRQSRAPVGVADGADDELAEREMPPHARRYRRGDLRLLERLREENPERFARLMQLRQEDREAFRQELRQMVQDIHPLSGLHVGARQQEIAELVRQYHRTETEAERERLQEQLRQLLAAVFDEKIERSQHHIEMLSERLQRMTGELEEKKEQREQLIDHQLQYLLEKTDNHTAGD